MYDKIDWSSRMLALTGPRGIGKTTLFLQHIKEQQAAKALSPANTEASASSQTIATTRTPTSLAASVSPITAKNPSVIRDTLYFSADNLYFANHTLFEVADRFAKLGGKFLYIDEVHKYADWSRQLKAIYDTFPSLHVYFTGSSILDILSGQADLSRRAPTYHMQGLSFREYLAMRHGIEVPVLSFEDVLAGASNEILNAKNTTDAETTAPSPTSAHIKISSALPHPLAYFADYLRRGYYPFGQDPAFELELNQVITRTLEVDIPQYVSMGATAGRKLARLLVYVAQSVPFKLNASKVAAVVGISRNNVEEYLTYMQRAGLVSLLHAQPAALRSLAKPDKIYLDNTNLMYALVGENADIGTVRETFFQNQVRATEDMSKGSGSRNTRTSIVADAVHTSPVADFLVEDYTFEVGGKNKDTNQVAGIDKAYIVRDDVEFASGNILPLWAFGLLY
jgi:hypothetical protein